MSLASGRHPAGLGTVERASAVDPNGYFVKPVNSRGSIQVIRSVSGRHNLISPAGIKATMPDSNHHPT